MFRNPRVTHKLACAYGIESSTKQQNPPVRSSGRRWSATGSAVALASAYLIHSACAQAAVTLTVNTTADNTTDDGVCSLREAIYSANNLASLNGDCPAGSSSGTIIKLGSHTYAASAPFDIVAPVTIRGNGASSTIVRGNLDASVDYFFAVWFISGDATFEKLTIDGGALAGDTAGIGAFASSGLNVVDASVRDFTNGGIRVLGVPVLVSRSSVFNNSTDGNGGGVSVSPYFAGLGSLRIEQSAIYDNDASGAGGGVYFTGGGNNQWNDSTISSNYAGTLGGGIYIETPDGGQYVQMNRLTIAANDAWSGGGFNHSPNSFANLYMYDTIVGDNTATVAGSRDGSGKVSTAEYCLFETSAGISFLSSANLILGVDAKLDPLQTSPSGIPTKVHPLRSTSPALNVKSWSAAAVDQRGLPRGVGFGANKFDIGAFERQ